MRKLFTTEQAAAQGMTRDALRWAVRRGRCVKVDDRVWAWGGDEPAEIDRRRARVLATRGIAGGTLAGVLLEFDCVALGDDPGVFVDRVASARRAGVVRRPVADDEQVTRGGVPCTNALRTLVDLAALLDDATWEQALESALRREHVTIDDMSNAAADLRRRRRPGADRIRRVLAARGEGVPPTGSLLETLMLQLSRLVAGVPAPHRQVRIFNEHREFVARVDLCWPEVGLFVELDGQGHLGQPVHDASRETAVVAATGWLVGRFTWHEVVRTPHTTARRVAALVAQARLRPVAG